MRDLWIIDCEKSCDLKLRFENDVPKDLRANIKSFLWWIRRNYVFPYPLTIYILNSKRVITYQDEKEVSASIFFPYNPRHYPNIRISIGDYQTECGSQGEFQTNCSILASIAHEITHYFQWLKQNMDTENAIFDEKQARYKAVQIVNKFIDDKYRKPNI